MADLLDALHQDHKNYVVLLDLLEAQAHKLEQGNTPDYLRMYDIANYMVNYPDSVHHPHEELIFATLKTIEPDCLAKVDELSKEHKQLAAAGLALKDAVYSVISGAIISKDDILDHASAYINLLRNHMNTEEGNIFPKIKELLTDTDWQSIDKKLQQTEDPLFGAIVQAQFAKLYDGIEKYDDDQQ